MDKMLSHFILYSSNLKASILSLEISRLINFVFSRENFSFVLKTEYWEMIAKVSFDNGKLDFIF